MSVGLVKLLIKDNLNVSNIATSIHNVLGLLSLIWFNSNPIMDKLLHIIHHKDWVKINYPFPTSTVQPLKFGNG